MPTAYDDPPATVKPSLSRVSANTPVAFGHAASTPSSTARSRKKQKDGKGSSLALEKKDKGKGEYQQK